VELLGRRAHAAQQGDVHEDVKLARTDVYHQTILYTLLDIQSFFDRV
jgi:hypothetical protein